MSGLFRYVESMVVQELLDYSSYDNHLMLFDIMGFGRRADADVPAADPALLGGTFRAPLMLVADGMGAEIERFVYDREVWLADRPFDIAAGRIEVGTVAAQRFSATAIVDGRRALEVEHITRLGSDSAPEWPTGRGWKVAIEGMPSMRLESTIAVHGEDENDQGCLGTAMHAVHSIGPVCAAPSGIKTFLDLPMIIGRHVLRSPMGRERT
jgi:hypothetical protein